MVIIYVFKLNLLLSCNQNRNKLSTLSFLEEYI